MKPLLERPEFPRSNRYDAQWMMDNQMGPNVLWLTEWLTQAMDLKPGMRILDLGCGRAASSIFLAREFDVRVWAADLWITPDYNWNRVCEAEETDRVFPLRAEAHALPFPAGFFDAVVSVDAYQYFGTDRLYLGYLRRFVKTGGAVGVVMPGLMRPLTRVPGHLSRPQSNGKVFWENECWSFMTADEWRLLWERSGAVDTLRADVLKDGWRHWRDFERALEESGKLHFPSDAEALDADAGETVGFIRLLGRVCGEPGENLYDPHLGREAGVDT